MKLILVACFALFSLNAMAYDTYVRGYTRHDGTYVQGYHRSAPDNTVDNNYSTRGNTNPYTGTQGTQPRSDERTNTDTTSQGYRFHKIGEPDTSNNE